MLTKIVLALMVVVPTFSATQDAHANSLTGLARGLQLKGGSNYISEQRPTLAPFAQIRFCVRNPSDCTASQGGSILDMSSTSRKILQDINTVVNRSIRPLNDSAGIEQGDLWQTTTTSGDCEDYALTKRHALIQQGIPSRTLRIAIARTPSGEGHAVLVVRTSEGDLVLDNRTNAIKPWHRVKLRWLKIQSAENPKLWFTI